MGLASFFREIRPSVVASFWLSFSLLAGLFGCSSSPSVPAASKSKEAISAPAWFEDVTLAVGLDFVHDPGEVGTFFMHQSMGSGGAFLDFDGDGKLDILLLHQGGENGKKNQLFRQKADGTFQDASAGSGLDFAGFNLGVAVGDVNNDGLPDVLVTQYGGITFFLNRGAGKFEDVTEKSKLRNPVWGSSAAFMDFDRDGWLDLVVVNYLDYDSAVECNAPNGAKDFCGPSQFSGRSAKLFRNRGTKANPGGSPVWQGFDDVSVSSGIARLVGPGLGVVCADFDGDGWQDVFVSNDGKPNRLWINRRDGTFAEEAVSRGVAYNAMGSAFAGMGIAVGDTAGTGMLDLFVTHLGTETHTLWRQQSRGQFSDTTAATGLLKTEWRGTGFGTLMTDIDLDGHLDVAIVNGRVHRGGTCDDPMLGFWQTYAERNQLLRNDGTGKFLDVSTANPAFTESWNVGRGLACGDFDNDGAPDLLVTSIGGRAKLFRNVMAGKGHWLKVRAIEPKLKRDAYGAEIVVHAGDHKWLRLVSPAESYLSSSSLLSHFGLGKIDRIDAIQIRWPDGTRERFDGGGVDRLLELRRGEGRTP